MRNKEMTFAEYADAQVRLSTSPGNTWLPAGNNTCGYRLSVGKYLHRYRYGV
jgi:hypothetical protein